MFTDDLAGIIAAGRRFDARGWLPGGSGNFSLRTQDGFWMTVSGKHKGFLTPEDFLHVMQDGQWRPQEKRPSAEMALHRLVYEKTTARCVLHVHSPFATVASLFFLTEIRIQGLELQKAFAGVDTHESLLTLSIFDNNQDVSALSADVARYWDALKMPAFLIRGHGFYTWAGTVESCVLQVEALEMILRVIVQLRQLALPTFLQDDGGEQ